ncbi:MAG: glycosyltransferase family 4 protein [Planctomycetes bacterium]|nr:glycosyltransferase family 4 protein [Planctomycetota bacterium]
MTIVHLVLGKANPERPNGVNRAVDGLARAQTHLGAQVEVWGITPTPLEPTSARAYTLRLFPTASSAFRLARALRSALAALGPLDVVHLHGGYHPEWHAAARILRRGGTGFVITPHGAFRTAVVQANWIKKRAWLALVETRLLERALAVQVFSQREASELRAYAPHAHCVVLPNGIDCGAEPAAAHAPDGIPRFGFLGRLDEHTKGLDLLLEGFATYVRAGGRGRLAIVGGGSDEHKLRTQCARLGLVERVEFHGERFGEDKQRLLEDCDAFLHPSRHEGMPMSVLEAAARGLPCVLSRETNLAEDFESAGAGLVLDPLDAPAIAAALLRCDELLAAGALARMGHAARSLARERFEIGALAARSLRELYGAATPVASRAG